MSGSALFSSLFGYTSIACWLGAQFPQVFENFRRQSCEGLALPFLANWFLGDFSNLIGCILTSQLPFQRYLATYFCSIDLVLLSQYIYYQNFFNPPSSLSSTTFHSQRAASSISTARRLSADRSFAPRATRHNSDPLLRFGGPRSLTSHIPLGQDHVLGDSEDDHPITLIDNFYSEGGKDISRKRVSWSIGRNRTRANSTSSISAAAPSNATCSVNSVRRGRSLGRNAEEFLQNSEEARQTSESLSSPWNCRNSRAGKKSATMVFLGTWALFGVGTFVGNKQYSSNTNIGRVLSLPSPIQGHVVPIAVTSSMAATEPWTISDTVWGLPVTSEDQDLPSLVEHVVLLDDSKPSLERIVGRISAWLCATLYLTSRLPQIWKNFVRKSVEGLSMYLFVFAFLGNIFYVASILFSPNVYLPSPQSTAFLKESIPYLLGSGGTLIFDIIIVTQSFIYKPKHKRRNPRSTVNLEIGDGISEDVTESERTGLLVGDVLAKRQQPASLYSTPAEITEGVVSTNKGDAGMIRGRSTHVARSLSDWSLSRELNR
ncbi:hypothetical protein Ac2012v2_001887 [Leucoagaricus gongylophorus]